MDRPLQAPQLSLHLINFASQQPASWDRLFEMAISAEQAGVDRLVVSDHVVFGEDLDAYGDPRTGGTTGGRQPTGPDGHWLEPLTVLSAVSARTSRIRLGTSILIAALRNPVVLAKTLATMDVLSGGRLDLGVGVGWQRAEYDACGVAFGQRGAILDDCLKTMQSLWRQPTVEMNGASIHQMPKPLQGGGVPIWVSGRSTNPNVVDRIVRFGTGWIPWGDDAADPVRGIERIRTALAESGRDPGALQVTTTLPDEPSRLVSLVDAGVTDFRIPTSVLGRRGHTPPVDARREASEKPSIDEHLSVVVERFRSGLDR